MRVTLVSVPSLDKAPGPCQFQVTYALPSLLFFAPFDAHVFVSVSPDVWDS
jgi:hypothetical protein